MKTNPFALTLLLLLTLVSASVLSAKKPASSPKSSEAKTQSDEEKAVAEKLHAERAELYGPKYLTALKALKEEGSPEEQARLAKHSDEVILDVSQVLEARYAAELTKKLDEKTARAEESIPSLFYGMLAFALAMGAFTVFSLLRVKSQSQSLRELEAQVAELRGKKDEA